MQLPHVRTNTMNQYVLKAAIDLVTHFVKRRVDAPPPTAKPPAARVEQHLNESLNWSKRIQFYGMSRAEETESATIPLRLNLEPRRFRGTNVEGHRTESDLLADDRNYLLLGDPGAGKTTTLKRIVQNMLLDEPVAVSDDYAFPIVLRLRELPPGESIVAAIATTLGIPFERLEKSEPRRTAGLWLADAQLHHAIADFLNESHAVLLLDGLDEAPADADGSLRRELQWLGFNTAGAKIVISCRTGDYTAMVEGYDLLEICPLDQSEIIAIARLWLNDPVPFVDELARVPYGDVADRPLLLTQLLFLYKRYGYLPDQPSQVYRRVISLLLQEWDAERGISRISRYARFDPDRKTAFLAGIAYQLTFKIKKKIFLESDLIEAYRAIHGRFQLPTSEVRQVIAEIETHTGIIAVAGQDSFEFSHLSLQEYLCADYLVREPHSEHLNDYLTGYPAPVAIAIALSSNPSIAFAALFLKDPTPPLENLGSFLSRLVLERPFFDVSPELGMAVMRLYRTFATKDDIGNLNRFVALPAVSDSVSGAFRYFDPVKNAGALARGCVRLNRSVDIDDVRGLHTPEFVFVPTWLIDELYLRGDANTAALVTELRTADIPHGA